MKTNEIVLIWYLVSYLASAWFLLSVMFEWLYAGDLYVVG